MPAVKFVGKKCFVCRGNSGAITASVSQDSIGTKKNFSLLFIVSSVVLSDWCAYSNPC